LKLQALFKADIELAPALELGAGPLGRRRIIAITGGRFCGERLSGRVHPGGADWQVIRADGVADLDARYTFETDDGALIYMTFTGLRDDTTRYFRTLPRFETAAPQYAFLNRLLAVGIGEIGPDGAVHVIEEIL